MMGKYKQRLLFVVNDPSFFISHRLAIALAAKNDGWDVHVVTAKGEAAEEIKRRGLIHHVVNITRSGKNPFTEIAVIWSLVLLMRQIKPDIAHLVTIKPVLYGGLAARIAKVHAVVAAISGLGSVFTDKTTKARLLRWIVHALYRVALRHKNIKIIFQNPTDESVLVRLGAVKPQHAVRIRGSGVAMENYPFVPEPEGEPVVSFAARLLKEKGVKVFVDAARQLKARGVHARFWLIGSTDPGNPATITEQDLSKWRAEGVVELLGYRGDIASLFAQSNIVALPSYYGEGLPKVLIEAAACGRAVVTTDHPGCRDAIEPDETGLLVPLRDSDGLADAIEYLINNPDRRRAMGCAGRELAERAYAIEKVVDAHLEVYRELYAGSQE